ncbi:MAG: hypothetical protein ABIG71_00220 [Candidatus Uhrbacteria bacterium]
MDKTQRDEKIRREMRRLYAAIRRDDFDVQLVWFNDRGVGGTYQPAYRQHNDMISIDVHKDLVRTFVHELIHHVDDELSESKVCALTNFILRRASLGQLKRLLRHFRRLWRATLSVQFRHRPMPHCPLCGQRVQRVADEELAKHYQL